MIVEKLDTWHLKLDFLSPIKHNLATHEGSDNIVLGVTTGDAIMGFGEGVPRTFVTGEVLSDSLAFLRQVLAPAILARDFSSPQALVKALRELYQHVEAQRHPAAFCALETALLDAAGQTWGMPVAELIGPKLRTTLEYSAVVPMLAPEKMGQLFQLVKSIGMRFIKLKVGTDDDLSTLRLARDALGDEVDIRVDANSAWTPAEAIARLREMQPYRLSAVEQPVAKTDFAGLKQVQEAIQIPVIADESLCNEDDARRLIDLKACQGFSSRISAVQVRRPGNRHPHQPDGREGGGFLSVGVSGGRNQYPLRRRSPFRLNRASLILCRGLVFPLPAGPGCSSQSGGLQWRRPGPGAARNRFGY